MIGGEPGNVPWSDGGPPWIPWNYRCFRARWPSRSEEPTGASP